MPRIEKISAVTFAVSDMARSVDFYKKLGFRVAHGGARDSFVAFNAGSSFVNLIAETDYAGKWWGRAIFRIDDADSWYRAQVESGLTPDRPRDAPWGERFFHITDPDGHELSFAELLRDRPAAPGGSPGG